MNVVREIAPVVPTAPAFIKGVRNLRGAIVPIVGLCLKLGARTVAAFVDSVSAPWTRARTNACSRSWMPNGR